MPGAPKPAALLALLASLPACRSELAVPAGVRIACESSHDCPPRHQCVAELARCVPAEHDDRSPPDLVSAAVITPARVRVGQGAVMALEVSEPLGAPPVASLGGRVWSVEAASSYNAVVRWVL